MIILLFGPPGSGKGTQAQYLADKGEFLHISTGDLLRAEINKKTPLGLEIEEIINKGFFIKDDVVLKLVEDAFDSAKTRNIVFDGFPRTQDQAIKLDKILIDRNLKVDLAIEFNIDIEQLVERVSGRRSCAQCGTIYHHVYRLPVNEGICDVCGGKEFLKRNDDNPDTLKNRLDIYIKETEPVTKYYAKQNILVTLEASKKPGEVSKDLNKYLSNLVKAKGEH